MTHAIVLVKVTHDALPTLGSTLADVVTGGLGRIPGIERTQTMMAFEVFSQHDLEAMFLDRGVRCGAGGRGR
jgi:hypothetical protein